MEPINDMKSSLAISEAVRWGGGCWRRESKVGDASDVTGT